MDIAGHATESLAEFVAEFLKVASRCYRFPAGLCNELQQLGFGVGLGRWGRKMQGSPVASSPSSAIDP